MTSLGPLGSGASSTSGLWFTVSTDGSGSSWSSPKLIQQSSATVTLLHDPIILPSASHTNYAFWYDPVWAPYRVNLHWHYDEWSSAALPPTLTESPHYGLHVGEYNGAASDNSAAFLTWTDYRLLLAGTRTNRQQADIRLLRLSWEE